MTKKDEEKASEIVIKIQNSSSLDYDGRRAKYMYESAMQMAKWKDEDFAKEKQALIDKACEWLSIHDNYSTPTHVLVEQLRQAMKGGEYENDKV